MRRLAGYDGIYHEECLPKGGRLAEHLEIDEEEVGSASPHKVKEVTDWSIGGVPPFCHRKKIKVLMDPKLLDFDEVWAAAGTPKAVFNIKPKKPKELAEAKTAETFQ